MLVLIVKMNLIIPNPKTTNLLEDALIHSKLLPAVYLGEKSIMITFSHIKSISYLIFLFSRMAGRRPERAAGNGVWLDHQAWTKIVMGACLGIIVYYQMQSKSNKEVPLAKNSEFLNGKRSQVSICAPIFKREIENLGNPSKIFCDLP